MKRFSLLKKNNSTLIYFLSLNFFWIFSATIFSYILPVLVEIQVQNVFWVGLLMSLGAVAGMFTDTITSLKFAHVKYKFYYLFGFLSLLAVAVLSNIPGIAALIAVILIFGIAYEIFVFGQEALLAKGFSEKKQLKVSGLAYTLFTISVLVTPFLVEDSILNSNFIFPIVLFTGIVFLGIAFLLLSRTKELRTKEEKPDVYQKISFLTELKIWRVLWKDSGYILIVMLIITMADAFFWTVGPLFVLEYAAQANYAELLLPLFMLPGLFVNVYTGRLAKRFGEGRALMATLLLGGLFLFLFILTDNLMAILFLTFISSIFQSAAFVMTESILAHLIKRLDGDGAYLIGLRGLSTDIAYIIGPILAGIVAQIVGIRLSFAFLGLFTVIMAIFMFSYDPHKTKLSKAKINKLEESDQGKVI